MAKKTPKTIKGKERAFMTGDGRKKTEIEKGLDGMKAEFSKLSIKKKKWHYHKWDNYNIIL